MIVGCIIVLGIVVSAMLIGITCAVRIRRAMKFPLILISLVTLAVVLHTVWSYFFTHPQSHIPAFEAASVVMILLGTFLGAFLGDNNPGALRHKRRASQDEDDK